VSFDDDHVVADLRERFDDVLLALEDSQGWVTARLKPPVRIFGSLDGVETGVRNLIRTRPLEVERVAGGPSRPAGRGRRAAHPGRLLRDQRGSGGHRIATQVAKQLAEPAPGDLSEVDLTAYRQLQRRWQDCTVVADASRALALAMLDRLAKQP